MLSFRDRLILTWSMTWPLLVIDVFWTFFVHEAFPENASTADSLFQPFAFFVLGPLTLRRAVRLGTPHHQIAVLKGGQPASMGLGDAFCVVWLLGWRSLVLGLLALLPLSLLLKLVVPPGLNAWVREIAASPTLNALGLAAVDGIINLAFVPFLIPAMLRKQYRRFTLQLQTRPEPTTMKSASRSNAKRNLSNR